jgi:C1A family cysteine protease
VFGITLFPSFESDSVAATGQVPMPLLNEQPIGGHAVLVSGYNQVTRRFKVRNSWGADWGDRGYFYLPYDYVFARHYASEAWVIQDVL